ncbi:hypothetical protein XELAEV_18045408mg [Xenopus laevis]|uniref:Uncharacterized protein n=1 Tax=Xenopus laevis TaxID=8355 RepID=A0A974C1G4_XENLA|nr:hypothetical protein XELAEV_18045408mg [Xenopus laevis]
MSCSKMTSSGPLLLNTTSLKFQNVTRTVFPLSLQIQRGMYRFEALTEGDAMCGQHTYRSHPPADIH